MRLVKVGDWSFPVESLIAIERTHLSEARDEQGLRFRVEGITLHLAGGIKIVLNEKQVERFEQVLLDGSKFTVIVAV